MLLLSIFVGSAVICYAQAEYGDLVIQTEAGLVKGWERDSRDGRVYQAWTGIPYAEPPLGPLRFKPPKPKSSWDGVFKATGDAPECLQVSSKLSSLLFPNVSTSEDCLYLNVYRPKNGKKNMSVIVHVHGGAFQNGNMGARTSAEYLMDEDIVLVGIQYRLNAFGFMSLGDSVMPGNFGLKDQVLALKWVKRNIAAFGGNPHSVTVIGESAGAASAHILLKSPAADDLVHRAVSESGTINRFSHLLNPDRNKRNALRLAEEIGCSNGSSQEMLKCLQDVDASVIISKLMEYNSISRIDQLFMPVIEPEDAEDAVATFDLSLRPTKKPWITSVTTGEWTLFKSSQGHSKIPDDKKQYLVGYLSMLNLNLTEDEKLEAAEAIEKIYFPKNSSADPLEQSAKMEADLSFVYPIMKNIALHEGPKWIYRFEYQNAMTRLVLPLIGITEKVAFHASQIKNYLRFEGVLSTLESAEDEVVSKRTIKYLVNFANFGDPTPGAADLKWNQFNGTELLRVTRTGDYYADQEVLRQMTEVLRFWDNILGWE